MMYEFAIEQFPRLGFMSEKDCIDADEANYIINLKSSVENKTNAAIGHPGAKATVQPRNAAEVARSRRRVASTSRTRRLVARNL
jgi:hypothetical protein